MSPWKEDQGTLTLMYRNYPYRLFNLKAIIQILIMKSLWLSFWSLKYCILMLLEHALSFTFRKHIMSLCTLTMPESKYHNSLMERKPAVNTLGGWYAAIMVCCWKICDIFNNMKRTKVFKQMEQTSSNNTLLRWTDWINVHLTSSHIMLM